MAEQMPGGDDIEVEAPDGKRIAFPSTMSQGDIAAAMRRLYPPQNVSATADVQPNYGSPGKPLAPSGTASPSTSAGGSGGAGSGREQEIFDREFQVTPAPVRLQPVGTPKPAQNLPPFEPSNWQRI